ncbi:MAG: endopeptidase La [Deltaproteobacteria bacterium]|nr:endopeptidase La [Deltaproteobacteria bacterium]
MADDAAPVTTVQQSQQVPEQLPVLPLRQGVLYPELTVPLMVTTPEHKKLVDDALVKDQMLAAVAQKNDKVSHPRMADLYQVGVAVFILKMMRTPDGAYHLLVRSFKKIRLLEAVQEEPYLVSRIQVIDEHIEVDQQIEAMVVNIRNLFQKMVALSSLPDELGVLAMNVPGPYPLIYLVASNLDLPPAQAQEVLESEDLNSVLEQLTVSLNKKLETLELSQEIQKKVKEGMDKSQRDFLLREQLKAIQKELGESDERTMEVEELRKRLADTPMPAEARKAAEKELDRLSRMPPAAAEYTVSRTYLDWLLDLPWETATEDNLDMAAARQTLDQDHYDLEKVKKRILEYLAVRKLKKDLKGPIICFVGPPGVGKTSLGQSIARTLGRKFVRISLGGVRDEAEIRGHRRTYVGALPGRIIQGLRKAGTNNPVFMLDEIDKVGTDFRGDPSSALLEVLDPEQNSTFSDHYLEVPFDLSRVMFITTANILETIPAALRDRMEVMELPGYTDQEKLLIAKRHLLPTQLQEHGLSADLLTVEDEAIVTIIRSYTREAGVRNLERQLAALCRSVASAVASGREEATTITSDNLADYLGPAKYIPELTARTWGPGLATGLAWTPTGGEIIFIEAARMPGKGNLTLTGQLGDVMKESATAALTYVRAHATELGLGDNSFDKTDIHVHVPAGAIPKDGPSAGIAMLVALTSLMTGRQSRREVAMTGEITLRGDVLPVGGIKEKVLAASRADLVDVPEEIRHSIRFHFVRAMPEALEVALETQK